MANFDIGDKVKHKVFGEGSIMEIDEGNSAKLTIAFGKDKKVIMSSFVKLLKQMKDELTGIPWIIEWYKNLTGWRSFVYGSIIVGVGMFIAKRIFPMIEVNFDKLLK